MSSPKSNQACYQYFPTSFDEGRTWFETAVAKVSDPAKRFVLPNVTGPAQEPLSIGLAWIGPGDAKRVYLSICGTHGQEYFCGAAGQLAWLDSNAPTALPGDLAVCLIHALNPYGAAHFSRGNADFVDLNRNYRDVAVPMRNVPLFETVANALQTKKMDERMFYDVMAIFNQLLEDHDPAAVMDAIAGGQSAFPRSIMYAGQKLSWEIETLQTILGAHFRHAEKVALIDWHTGLGPPGKATVINTIKPGEKVYKAASAWWGKPADTSAIYDSGVEPDLVGQVCHGAAATLRDMGVEVIETVIELGTVSNDAIIPAFLTDRWLRFECEAPQSPRAVQLKTMMMERYNPSLPEWRRAALQEMARLYEKTIIGLRSW